LESWDEAFGYPHLGLGRGATPLADLNKLSGRALPSAHGREKLMMPVKLGTYHSSVFLICKYGTISITTAEGTYIL